MAQQTMLRLFFLKYRIRKSGESDSQKSQSSSRTDKQGCEVSGSEFLFYVVSAMIDWFSETFQRQFFY